MIGFQIEDARIRIDHSRLTAVVGRQVEAAARRAAHKTRDRIQANIRRRGRIDTGRMLESFTITSDLTDMHPRMFINSTAPYTHFQERGTRAHGPVRARFLVFTPKGSNAVVFAKRVRGVRAGNFIRDAQNRLTPRDFAP